MLLAAWRERERESPDRPTFPKPVTVLAAQDNSGASVLYPGVHTLTFTRGHGKDVAISVTIAQQDGFVLPRV